MSDDLIINLIWGVMELEQKFEDDPYSYLWKRLKFYSTMKNTELARGKAISIEL